MTGPLFMWTDAPTTPARPTPREPDANGRRASRKHPADSAYPNVYRSRSTATPGTRMPTDPAARHGIDDRLGASGGPARGRRSNEGGRVMGRIRRSTGSACMGLARRPGAPPDQGAVPCPRPREGSLASPWRSGGGGDGAPLAGVAAARDQRHTLAARVRAHAAQHPPGAGGDFGPYRPKISTDTLCHPSLSGR
jgi:hypothetical protein